jgi:hypothetical protein
MELSELSEKFEELDETLQNLSKKLTHAIMVVYETHSTIRLTITILILLIHGLCDRYLLVKLCLCRVKLNGVMSC